MWKLDSVESGKGVHKQSLLTSSIFRNVVISLLATTGLYFIASLVPDRGPVGHIVQPDILAHTEIFPHIMLGAPHGESSVAPDPGHVLFSSFLGCLFIPSCSHYRDPYFLSLSVYKEVVFIVAEVRDLIPIISYLSPIAA